MDGRRWTWSIVLCLVVVCGSTGAFRATNAQGDSGSLFAAMGYPELAIDISDTGIDLPASVPAGRTLIVVHNSGSSPTRTTLARFPDASDPESTPVVPAGLPPNWLAESTFPGMPSGTLPGATAYGVADLQPGVYAVLNGVTVRQLIVTEAPGGPASPSPIAEPMVAGTVSLFEYDFQLPATIASGAQIWNVLNAGREPHELVLVAVPEGTTREDLLDAAESGFASGEAAGGLAMLSPGASAWIEVDLAPGTYGAVCYVIDPATGMTHAMEGMIEVFTVG